VDNLAKWKAFFTPKYFFQSSLLAFQKRLLPGFANQLKPLTEIMQQIHLLNIFSNIQPSARVGSCMSKIRFAFSFLSSSAYLPLGRNGKLQTKCQLFSCDKSKTRYVGRGSGKIRLSCMHAAVPVVWVAIVMPGIQQGLVGVLKRDSRKWRKPPRQARKFSLDETCFQLSVHPISPLCCWKLIASYSPRQGIIC